MWRCELLRFVVLAIAGTFAGRIGPASASSGGPSRASSPRLSCTSFLQANTPSRPRLPSAPGDASACASAGRRIPASPASPRRRGRTGLPPGRPRCWHRSKWLTPARFLRPSRSPAPALPLAATRTASQSLPFSTPRLPTLSSHPPSRPSNSAALSTALKKNTK